MRFGTNFAGLATSTFTRGWRSPSRTKGTMIFTALMYSTREVDLAT